VRQGDLFHESHRHISRNFVSNPKTSLLVEQPVTLVRRLEVQKRTVANPMHTEQTLNLKRQVTRRHVAALNVCSEQNITLNRRTEISTRIALHTEQPISVQKKVEQKRLAILNVNSDLSFTLVTSGTRKLREQLLDLAARVEELEKTRP